MPVQDPVDLLRSLVAVPSLNPMGQTGPTFEKPPYLEHRLADVVHDWISQQGLDVHRQTVLPGRDNLWATSWAADAHQKPHYLWEVHLDTVPVEGMTIDPFAGTVDDGRLYARGACDNKGPMTAMLLALAQIAEYRRTQPDDPFASITLALTVDEEHTFLGIQHFAEQLNTFDPPITGAIVAEPTELNIVDAHKGLTRCLVRAKGRAGHSSQPDAGRNAIYALAQAALLLEELHLIWTGLNGHPRLGSPTLSVGRFQGGTAVNIIPDHAHLELDLRFAPPWTPDEALHHVTQHLFRHDHPWTAREVQLNLDPPWVKLPALSDEHNQPLADALAHAIETELGRPPQRRAVPFGTDAAHLAQQGVPAVVFGPGSIAQAHTRDEFIEISQITQAQHILCQFARQVT